MPVTKKARPAAVLAPRKFSFRESCHTYHTLMALLFYSMALTFKIARDDAGTRFQKRIKQPPLMDVVILLPQGRLKSSATIPAAVGSRL